LICWFFLRTCQPSALKEQYLPANFHQQRNSLRNTMPENISSLLKPTIYNFMLLKLPWKYICKKKKKSSFLYFDKETQHGVINFEREISWNISPTSISKTFKIYTVILRNGTFYGCLS
jgi:hypothetical protein